MTGWQADGRTDPKWRSCEHLYMNGDRCDTCRARRVESEPQLKRLISSVAGAPMGHYIRPKRDLLLGLEHLKGSISAQKWNHDNGNGATGPNYDREAA